MEENRELVEEMLVAKTAPEPGTQDKVIQKGDDESPRMTIKWISSAGYVWVWDNRTGECSKINRNMLETQLRKKRLDGSRVFTTINPKIPVKRGNLKCMLHAKDPNREQYDALGLPTCRKENITSPYQVRRHMEKRHPQEWAAIKEEITRKEKEEERQLRESLIKMGQAKVEAPLYQKEAKKK